MKKVIIIALILAAVLPAGCGGSGNAPDTSVQPTDSQSVGTETSPALTDGPGPPSGLPPELLFKAGGLTIKMGGPAAPIIQALGEPINYFESPSCAFDGIDKIYVYNGFELFTFPVDGEDFVLSVNLTDDSVTTNEGIYLGMALDKVIAAYGEDYTQLLGQYTYSSGGATLSFLIENDKIVVITYTFADIP